MITIKVNKNIISVQETEPITSGSVSVYKCQFTFDNSWEGFFRSAVFRCGSMVRTVPLDAEDMCDLPWELLDKKHIGLPVEVSVYGTKEETEILPTIWDKLGRVRKGSEPGEDVQKYSPSVYERIVSLIKAYSDKTKGDKGDKGDPGEGDMNAAVYDPQGRKTDAFKYADEQIARIPNPNLLHNWYFANPVNQRGQTEYSSIGYTIDRWKMGSTSGLGVGTVSIRQNEYLSVDCTEKYIRFTQTLDDATIVGKKAVLSVLTADGLHSNTLTIGAVYGGVNVGIATCYSVMSGDLPTVILDFKEGAVHDIIAVKFELGSTQTLAHQDADGNWVLNEIPDYGEELRKCQRYCYVLNTEKNPYIVFGMGVAANNTDANIVVPLPVKMRAYPNISMHGSLALFINGGWEPIEVTSIAPERSAMQGVVQLRASGTGLTVGEIYEFAANTDANAKLIFDANL